SPYSDGEKDAVIGAFANFQIGAEGAAALFSVTIRGEGAGRRMRGSARLRPKEYHPCSTPDPGRRTSHNQHPSPPACPPA
ncbi:hypothetical protein EN929_27615, partial [Mesorhizobium sp. M7A.F.Ca.CA.004.11.1.1]